MNILKIVFSLLILFTLSSMQCTPSQAADPDSSKSAAKKDSIQYTDDYWKKKLDLNTYQVTRCSRTEPPFQNKYWNNHAAGDYRCSNCGAMLFQSKDKFDSGTGWPSFTRAKENSVATKTDNSAGMKRDEIICKHCGAHLGHIFSDGPAPTGQRYCVNSASLEFKKVKN